MSSLPSESRVPRGLVEGWRADTPSPAELRRGYERFLRARSGSRPSRLFGRWLLFGALLGGGLAQGATVARQYWPSLSLTSPVVAVRARPATPPRAALPVPPANLSVEEPASPPTSAPETPDAPPRVTHSAAPLAEPHAPSSPEQATSRRWQRAAAAMRVHDLAEAEAALRELELTTRGAEHDAVLLTRAQVLASAGRSAEAIALARLVRAQSSSSVMRDKANELVLRLTNAPDRSLTPGAAIKQP